MCNDESSKVCTTTTTDSEPVDENPLFWPLQVGSMTLNHRYELTIHCNASFENALEYFEVPESWSMGLLTFFSIAATVP